jgi:hypothetical protein
LSVEVCILELVENSTESLPESQICCGGKREAGAQRDFSSSPIFPGRLFCAVNQILTRDAVANPWNRFQALGVYLLLAVETLAERALSNPLQRSVDCIQEGAVARFLAEVQLVCERRVCAIALVLAIVMLHSPSFLLGLGQALAKLPVARLERLFESLD